MTPGWIIKLDDAPSSVAIEYHTEVKTFDDQDWGAPWNANASSLKGAELSIYGRRGNRFGASLKLSSPIHQVASGLGLKDDIERRLSRPAHR
jgi:hypothetical protein